VHVALDTTPYNGTTTTCEALWMGVPVITMLGDRHAARVSSSLLRAAGHPELVAHDPEDFARRATDLSRDRARLAALRAGLRTRLASSTLCDATTYATRFHQAIRASWRQWCADAGR
jgi:predicted O-linked N-acetylglucosamine transferase (SPINDLY family)